MTNTEPHCITVTHKPLDRPGIRVGGSIAGSDVNFGYLRDILEESATNVALTDAALKDPALKDLATAVRGALEGLDRIAFHLLELHAGLAAGNVNYADEPRTGYPGDDR